MFTATWWGIGYNFGTLNIAGDAPRYRVNWGDGSSEVIRTDQDDDGNPLATTAYGHGYASDGTYDVSVNQIGAGLPPIRLRAFMYGSETDDIAIGGTRLDDIIVGGSGDDTLRGADGRDTIAGNDGADTISGGAVGDFLLGGMGNDIVRGDAGEDLITGNEGDDRVNGGNDRDFLYGDDGADTLAGDDGDDYLSGGAGADRLVGGAGLDEFVFAPTGGATSDPDRDTIADFAQGQDKLSIGEWAGAGSDFSFIATAAFSGTGAPEVRAFVSGSNTIVLGDANGDGAADFSFRLPGALTLEASDFYL